ncbi:MAG: 30S ribosomal protein S8e [Candidatus Geothermarchaeales archaeon]
MPQYHHGLRKRKATGARRRAQRKKRKFERGHDPTLTALGPTRRVVSRVKGGTRRSRLFSTQFANVSDPKTNTVSRTKIRKVESNPSNRDYDRRGIITKGAVILTEMGKAVVTSRPGHDAIVNAKLLAS